MSKVLQDAVGKYLSQTAYLSQGEHGAYLLLLISYYSNGIKQDAYESHTNRIRDVSAAYRIARAVTEEERQNVAAVLSEFFVQQEDGSYIHPGVELELARVSAESKKRSLAGKKAVEARWAKDVLQGYEEGYESNTNRINGDNNIYIYNTKDYSSITPENTSQASDEKFSRKQKRKPIAFDYATASFVGLDAYLPLWQQTYPGIDVADQCRRAAAWLATNPKRYKDYARFLNGWLSRCEPSHRPAAHAFAGVI